MLKPIFAALAGAAVIMLLKTVRPELALSVRIAVTAIIFIFAVSGIDGLIDYISGFVSQSNLDGSYIKLALKITGVCILSQTGADICRDCAETALATQVELAGRIIILSMSLPLIRQLLEISIGLIG